MCRIELVLDNLDKLSLVARFQVEQSPTIEYEPFQVQLRKSYQKFNMLNLLNFVNFCKAVRYANPRKLNGETARRSHCYCGVSTDKKPHFFFDRMGTNHV